MVRTPYEEGMHKLLPIFDAASYPSCTTINTSKQQRKVLARSLISFYTSCHGPRLQCWHDRSAHFLFPLSMPCASTRRIEVSTQVSPQKMAADCPAAALLIHLVSISLHTFPNVSLSPDISPPPWHSSFFTSSASLGFLFSFHFPTTTPRYTQKSQYRPHSLHSHPTSLCPTYTQFSTHSSIASPRLCLLGLYDASPRRS